MAFTFMHFTGAALTASVARLRVSDNDDLRAIGDNFHFDENVSPERIGQFERFGDDGDPFGDRPVDVQKHADAYFWGAVQGDKPRHVPACFRAENGNALIRDIEPTQKILTLERIDGAAFELSLDHLDAFSVEDRRPDSVLLRPLLDTLNSFDGERPAFACFRAEVESDLKQRDWLLRLLRRLGLGHSGRAGDNDVYPQWFMLMEYTVAEVLAHAQAMTLAGLETPFARPTVLESRNNPYFFPSPPHGGAVTDREGLAVNLHAVAAEAPVREIIRMRIPYQLKHVLKLGALDKPQPVVDLAAARNAHLQRVRSRYNVPDYGDVMTKAPEHVG